MEEEQGYPYLMGAKISKGHTSVTCESDFIIFNQYSQFCYSVIVTFL
jgi:hypothetical protein